MVSVAPCPSFIVNAQAYITPAHWLAYTLAKILHGDISVQNIMIDDEGNGMLIDWDFSKSVDSAEWHKGWQVVSMFNSYYLIMLICLVGNLAVHLCQLFAAT